MSAREPSVAPDPFAPAAAADPFAPAGGDPFAPAGGDPFASFEEGDPLSDMGPDPFAQPSPAPGASPVWASQQVPHDLWAVPGQPEELNLLGGYRRRGEDLLRLLDQGSDTTTALRQRELGKLAVLLTTLIEDLTSVGANADAVRELEQLRDALRAAQVGVLSPAEVDALERQSRRELQRFVDRAQAQAPPTTEPKAREGFWF